MVRRTYRVELEDGFVLDEYAGLSTDNKPSFSSLATGSKFLEVDTGDVYAYDEEAAADSRWGVIASLGGGS